VTAGCFEIVIILSIDQKDQKNEVLNSRQSQNSAYSYCKYTYEKTFSIKVGIETITL